MRKFIWGLFTIFSFLYIFSCGTESKPTYTVSTSVSPTQSGTIQVSPSGATYEEGTQVTVTGNPNENWVFNKWNGTVSSTQNPFKFKIEENINLTGVFTKRTYPLNINFEGEGTVSEQIIQSKSTDYEVGTLVELTPNPSEGWKFVEWYGDVQSSESVIQVSVDSQVNVTVVFEKKSYPLNITVEGEGSVEEEVKQSKSKEYEFGTVVELTPVPSQGWEFLEWSGDVESQEEIIEVTINRETNVTLTFDKPFYLNSNGITIMCPNTEPGETGIVEGTEYESVDRELLIQRINEGADLTRVCTSLVIDMRRLFLNSTFNQPIGNWDVSNVMDMTSMFSESNFNQPIGNWNVSNVTDMGDMFRESNFNQPIGNWDVSSVTAMTEMFKGSIFNQPLNKWEVSSVSNMSDMFQDTPFNQPIGSWDVSQVTIMTNMFRSAQFNQSIGNWDVSNVLDMSFMFYGTTFNQSINSWNVGNVSNMNGMFYNSKFNQPIKNWNVGNVSNMSSMFNRSNFNQSIENWDVSNVREMGAMFSDSDFNKPIGDWDVRNVSNMNEMFMNSPFNQSIDQWCVSIIPIEPDNFSTNSPLTEENKPVWGTCPDN